MESHVLEIRCQLRIKNKGFFSPLSSPPCKHTPPSAVSFHAVVCDFFPGLCSREQCCSYTQRLSGRGGLFLGCYQPGCCSSSAAVSCDNRSFLLEALTRGFYPSARCGAALHRCQVGCEASLCCAGSPRVCPELVLGAGLREPEHGPVPGTAQSPPGPGWLPPLHPANVQQAQSEFTQLKKLERREV